MVRRRVFGLWKVDGPARGATRPGLCRSLRGNRTTMQSTDDRSTERVDARTEHDDTARPDQASDLGQDFYWLEVSR